MNKNLSNKTKTKEHIFCSEILMKLKTNAFLNFLFYRNCFPFLDQQIIVIKKRV